MALQAIKYQRGKLQILDQLKLPYQEIFIDITSSHDAWNAIKKMQVRGAPAIAIVAALSLAVWLVSYLREIDEADEANEDQQNQTRNMVETLQQMLKFLVSSRPTAVNLSDAARKLEQVIITSSHQPDASPRRVAEAYIAAAEQMLANDVHDNESIGKHGASWLLGNLDSPGKISVLTHCNTGYV